MNRKLNRIFLVIILLGLLSPALNAQKTPPPRPEKTDIRVLLENEPEHNYDVLHYRFDWTLDYDRRHIEGRVTVEARSLAPELRVIDLHLDHSMAVTAVRSGQNALSFTHSGNLITITLPHSVPAEGRFEVTIEYHGLPQAGLNFSTHETSPIIWSLDEPADARHWFPCYDYPSDKATADIRITVPSSMVAASNGTLTGILVNSSDTVTYIWREEYPISTYLIFLAATNYQVLTDTYTSGTDSMPLRYFAYPEHLEAAREDFSITVSMIEYFADIFGEYPFFKEKYGMAEIPGRTSMEHQTCTSIADQLVLGTHSYDHIIAHELAHQWWGDLVSPKEWADIWLNEGFASYSEALWDEHLFGFPGLRIRMADFKERYFRGHEGNEHPIYDPPEGHLFCIIEYKKAAWVLHMLRHLTGEEDFWKILRTWGEEFAYSAADTEDFRSVCEGITGEDLKWFFDQWIYGSGYPRFRFGWILHNGVTRIIIEQAQNNQTFSGPLDIRFELPSGGRTETVWIDEKSESFSFLFPENPSEIRLDPDGWVLCDIMNFKKKGGARR